MVGVAINYFINIRQTKILERLRQSSLRITLFYRRVYVRWWKEVFIPEGLRQIRAGRGKFPPRNVGLWRSIKSARFGVNHSLGVLTGRLFGGFSRAKPFLSAEAQRGRIKARTRFTEPRYIGFVEEGTSRHRAYPFIRSTLDKTLPELTRRLGQITERDVLG